MAVRVAVNGFGRIGRVFFRAALESKDIEVVAVNDLADARTLAHLLKHDSVHGPLRAEMAVKGPDITVVLGVNEQRYDPARHELVSNASCTTNCLATVAKVLLDGFGINRGFATTVHAYTNDQPIHDFPHKDLRRARAGAVSMIPTTTGAATAVGLVLPELRGKLDGIAIRVPTANVSVIDLTAELEKHTSAEAVNDAFRAAAAGPMKHILAYTDLPLVSVDFNGNPHSAIVDGLSTALIEGHMVKVLAWYDNE